MLKKNLIERSDILLSILEKDNFLDLVEQNRRAELISLLEPEYNLLKEQLPDFHILHIHDINGTSILRMHAKEMYGDNLKAFRSHIKEIVTHPKKSTFYEVGKHGLYYRYITPLYNRDRLVGFLELGIRPTVIVNKIKKVFDMRGYVFVKNSAIVLDSINPLKADNYRLCTFCSQPDNFISSVLPQLKMDQNHYRVHVDHKTYHVINKPIYDGFQKVIGEMVLFKEVTVFENQLSILFLNSLILYFLSILIIYLIFNRYMGQLLKRLNRSNFILNNINDSVILLKPNSGKIIDANERAEAILGYTHEELLTKNIDDIKKSISDDEYNNWQDNISKLKLTHYITNKALSIKKDGSYLPVESNLTYLNNENEEIVVSVGRDISIQVAQEEQLQKQHNEMRRLNDLISESVLYTTADTDGNITYISKAFEKFTGYCQKEVLGKNHNIFKHKDTHREFFENMWSVLSEDKQFRGELKNRKKDGSSYWAKLTIDPIFDEDGTKIGYASYREDITDKKELEYISSHDQLTKLHNRYELVKHLQVKFKSATRYKHKFGYIMFDIDHFKTINDTYGHHVGDLVLIKLSDAVSSTIREDDFIARWGGEEFIIVTVDSTLDELILLVKKLQNKISKILFEPVINVTVSFGITIYKIDDDEESIQLRADNALYRAKENGRNRYEIS